ncbi:uncharacterized protein LOC131051163 isoform X1 [Cryptomeria japonica]|uniref:uncharacterized protein LOC131051163 isoform X1 n=1 Tax=Cryptomeria japonica TaxID=3369 RepID=UPI0027D9D98B|nr:uncharacterized protein LOC131051163 isoform X1 [Cryptomeria japonica]
MENGSEEVSTVLNYAIHRGSCDWAVALVELFEEVYGSAFVETAAAITFRNVESVPIFTKLLSLSPNQLQDQISNIKPRFAEVLMEAVERGYSELVEKMMSEFKDDEIAHITTDERVRALRAAVHRGYIKLVESLLKSRNGTDLPVEVDDKGKTLFHYALFHEQVFKLLQEMYASSYHNIITRQDKFGRNFLHCAAKGVCDSQVVYNILEESITSDKRLVLCHQRDDRGRTPLHIAASKGYSGMIEKLLLYFEGEEKTKYFQETDSFGRKLLQMAAVGGREDLVQMLLELGSQPLKERDGQKRTALHYAAQVKDPKLALATCKALVESRRLNDKDKSLLLWASGNGIGTADEIKNVNDRVEAYLRGKKLRYREDLLRNASVTDNAEMAWELLNRGADMADILDPDWRESLNTSEESSVKNVISHIERMKEQGRDQPSMDDNLGRHAFAEGVAALLLNRFVESPITVGISGEWGMGKSSLMIQIEKILLITAAQLTFPNLLPSEQFGGAKKIYLSTRGRKIYRQIKRGVHNILTPSKYESKNPLVTMLTEYQSQYHAVYKSLACMDNNKMLHSEPVSQQQQQQEHALRGVPRILTIRYNAWHYRDRHEAWAGLGVAITREIENAMTRAQWMSTCWRYTWAKHRVNIWIQVFLPCLLSISLAGWVAWIVWMLLKQAKFQGLKYGSIPFTVIAIAWVVLKSIISVVKPVSTQMLGYITSPDHTSRLGYQEDVIADINFLKKELGNEPHWFFSFILGVWCWNWFGLYADVIENTRIPKFMPASGDQIRIVTFVDDLDRCEEEVILQVLSAVNLVLAECKINVILGIDKKMIARAIRRKFVDIDDEDIAEKFICKIIQIPLSLPEPKGEEIKSFLKCHLGHEIPHDSTTSYDMKKENVFGSPHGLYVSDIEEEETSTIEHGGRSPRQEENASTCCQNTVLNIYCTKLERGSKGITKKAVDWLGWLLGFAFTVACNITTKLRQLYEEETLNSLRSAEGVRLIRELLMPNYSKEEANIFYKLSELASGNQKLPREWKRLLSYHRFARYVLFRIGNVHSLPTWEEELIGWIFICWQWKHEMNHLIKNWHKYTIEFIPNQNNDRKQKYWRSPLLSEIVDKIIADPMDQSKIPEKCVIVAEPMDKFKYTQSLVPEESKTTLKQRGLLKQDPSILCLYSDKERNNEGTSQNNWSKLKQALEIRDVLMEALQKFQHFRLHCETDYLPFDVFN